MPPKKKRKKKPKKEQLDFIALERERSNAPSSSQVVDVPEYKLVNVVSTCSLGVDNIDLRKLALEKNFLEFNPLTFAVSIYFYFTFRFIPNTLRLLPSEYDHLAQLVCCSHLGTW